MEVAEAVVLEIGGVSVVGAPEGWHAWITHGGCAGQSDGLSPHARASTRSGGSGCLFEEAPAEAVIADKVHGAQSRMIEPFAQGGQGHCDSPRSTRKDQRDYDKHIYKAHT